MYQSCFHCFRADVLNVLNVDPLRVPPQIQEYCGVVQKVTVYSEQNISLIDAKECFNIGVDSIFIDDPTELINNYK